MCVYTHLKYLKREGTKPAIASRGVPLGLGWRLQAGPLVFVLGQGCVKGQSGERAAGSGEVDMAAILIGG